MTYTRVFGHLGKADAHIAGGKGASLGEMTQAGIPVPPGFVVLASTFDRFLAKTDLTQEIDAILHTVKHDEMHTVEHASEKIQGLILAAQMPDDIATEILAEHEKLGAEFVAPQGHFQFSNAEYREENLVAVRSSATAEDGAEHAWAGQLDTHLNTPREEVVRNVQRCWASLFTPRAIFYRFEKGLHGTSISVAVVVQKMVQSELSGIAFSVHPVTEDRNQLIIEAGFGLGEAIVSGQVTPDSYVVEKNPRKIIDVNVSGQSKALYRKEGGGNEWQDLGEKGKTQVLTEAQILELSELIIRIENHYGFPCDIEWAYEGGKFYITQSRPITTLSSEGPSETKGGVSRVTSKARFKIYVEDYDVPISPWYILHDRGFKRDICDISGGVLRLDGLFVFQKDYAVWGADPAQFAAAGKYFMDRIERDPQFRKEIIDGHETSLSRIRNYVETVLQTCDFAGQSADQLFKIYADTYEMLADAWKWGLVIQYGDMGDVKYSDSVRSQLSEVLCQEGDPGQVFSILISPTKETYVGREIAAVNDTLVSIQADTASRDALEKAGSISELSPNFQALLEGLAKDFGWLQYYYEGPVADAGYYFGLLKRKWNSDPMVEMKERQAEREKMLDLQKRFESLLTAEQNLQVEVLREFTYLKELRKEVQVYMLNAAMDPWFKEVARRFGWTPLQARYVFRDEYESMLMRGENILDRTELEARFTACAYLLEDGNLIFTTGSDAIRMKDLFIRDTQGAAMTDQEEIRGSVAYAGKASGPVRIVNSVKDISKMQDGDVLVSFSTNPSLVPAMNRAGAIITNTGGITCHAAIVSRELRIPCIIGTKIATQVLKDGDMVEVDAERGVVSRIEPARV